MNVKVAIAGAGLGAVLWLVPSPGHASDQVDYEAIVKMMRECATITDVPARVSCYDNTIDAERLIGGSAQAGSEPAPGTPGTSAQRAGGFGADSLRQPRPSSDAEDQQVTLVVTAAQRLQPGIYLLTLEDGSQWQFVDAVPLSYDNPRAGSQIELARASLGSFQMRYASQRPVRIRRLR